MAVVLSALGGALALVALRRGRAWAAAAAALPVAAGAVLLVSYLRIPVVDGTVFTGSYTPLRGIPMSSAYDSHLSVAFDGLTRGDTGAGAEWGLVAAGALCVVQLLCALVAAVRAQPRTTSR